MKPNLLGCSMGITKVTVIGAGTMGAGIAQICAQAGWQTTLYDAYPEGLDRGMERINDFWDKGIARGKLLPNKNVNGQKNLTTEQDLSKAVDNCDLVIEAIPEILELKQEIFREVEQYCSKQTVFATNTSSLSIAKIAQGMDNPGNLIGMHF